jgi:hypothetical protein
MPAPDRRQHRPPHNITKPRRITTINDILARDSVNSILADLEKGKQNIKDLIIIYTDNTNTYYDPIETILREAKKPLTWTEIKEKAGFQQKVPNNKWVKWMEEDIGLVRERTKDGRTLWRLS